MVIPIKGAQGKVLGARIIDKTCIYLSELSSDREEAVGAGLKVEQ